MEVQFRKRYQKLIELVGKECKIILESESDRLHQGNKSESSQLSRLSSSFESNQGHQQDQFSSRGFDHGISLQARIPRVESDSRIVFPEMLSPVATLELVKNIAHRSLSEEDFRSALSRSTQSFNSAELSIMNINSNLNS